jgi:hypothetical protein
VSADAQEGAWAVGVQWDADTNHPKSFIVHWNGVRWSKVPSPG